ncbi:hypothetical protein PHMEG_00015792 [Phytophthora megakarya]|uniref:Uncharacterized protein n=1 Tax=Phytophthora megakarya TaxID=4795 RepID=A0A225W2Y4_9STRA|nr:hypothetical protein PHMEG_00015792 [Phytophthora megakarya]
MAAARLFKSLDPHESKILSPMSFVLWMREAECIKFVTTPAGRLGSRGLTLLHFREVSDMDSLVSGSNNSNFASDFSSSVQLPPSPPRCDSYDDILDGIHGLAAIGNEFWFDHARKLTSRLRVFVAKNKSADTDNNLTRVRLTLLTQTNFSVMHWNICNRTAHIGGTFTRGASGRRSSISRVNPRTNGAVYRHAETLADSHCVNPVVVRLYRMTSGVCSG